MTCTTRERKGGDAEFDKVTLEYGKAIATALSDLAPKLGAPAVEQPGGDGIALSVDAIPAIRALVTMAGIILKNIDGDHEKVSTCETALKVIADAGGAAMRAHVMANVMQHRIEHGDGMDARANVAGFTRPLRREDYN